MIRSLPSKGLALAALIFLGVACPLTAQAGGMPGQTCTALGMTAMADDGVNIVACLHTSNTDQSLVWKTMSGGDTGGIQCMSDTDPYNAGSHVNAIICINPKNGSKCISDYTGSWTCFTTAGWKM